jgi:hypothetical protein
MQVPRIGKEIKSAPKKEVKLTTKGVSEKRRTK